MIDQLESVVIGSEAIDAFTITARSPVGRAQIYAIFEAVTEIKTKNASWRNWRGLGYEGFICDGVRYGKRQDGAVLFATGREMSQRAAIEAIETHGMLEIRNTRIDLCVDMTLREAQPHWLYEIKEGKAFKEENKRVNRTTTYISSTSGDTLYIGKRTSAKYGRVYDKSDFYGMERGWVYRFEIESKKQAAPAVLKRLFPPKERPRESWEQFRNRAKRMIGAQFLVWGIQLPLEHQRDDLVRAEARVTTDEALLEWLSRTVKPAIRKLSDAGHRQLALAAIGVVDDVELSSIDGLHANRGEDILTIDGIIAGRSNGHNR